MLATENKRGGEGGNGKQWRQCWGFHGGMAAVAMVVAVKITKYEIIVDPSNDEEDGRRR